MLVLSRRPNETILLPTLSTSIRVVSLKPGVVRLGIEAPANVPVYREEVLDPELLARLQAEQGEKDRDDERFRQLVHGLNGRLNSGNLAVALLRRQVAAGWRDQAALTLDRLENELTALRQDIQKLRPAEPEAAPPIERPSAGTSFPRRKALVVEDDDNECQLLAGFLRLAGLEVDTAGDGASALDYLGGSEKPDVVLLDMQMPRIDGISTLRAIRGNPALAGLKVFGVSGHSPEKFGVRGTESFDGWFPKPLDPEILLREINGVLSTGR